MTKITHMAVSDDTSAQSSQEGCCSCPMGFVMLETGTTCEKCGLPPCYQPASVGWEKRWEEIVRPFGKTGGLFLVPQIDRSCQFWAIEEKENEIKTFIHTLLKDHLPKDVVRSKLEGMRKPETSVIHTRDIIQISSTEIALERNKSYNTALSDAARALGLEEAK